MLYCIGLQKCGERTLEAFGRFLAQNSIELLGEQGLAALDASAAASGQPTAPTVSSTDDDSDDSVPYADVLDLD